MPTVPTADTTDIMQAALDEAGFDAEGELTPAEPEIEPDIEPEVEPEPAVDAVADVDPDAEAEPEVDADAVAKAAAKVTNQDEFDALCDELGFRAPKPGQRENKIPQSRVRARVKTALKKYSEKFGTERTDLTGKLSAADTELQTFRRVDQAIAAGATDPTAARRYIEMLAAVHPAYKAFLGEGGAAASVAAVPQALKDLGPKPGPDLKYDDGTTGFSQEQLDKRDEWLAASAEIRGYERSKKEFETRFGPIETAHRTATERAAEIPKIEARVSAIREQWGELFLAQERTELAKKGSSDIAKYQAAHPGVPFEQVVAAVLLPKLQTDRTKMRAEILAELNGKKKAAKPSTGQATRTVTPAGAKSTTDIINEQIDKAGIDVD
jgi:hypothetical protein